MKGSKENQKFHTLYKELKNVQPSKTVRILAFVGGVNYKPLVLCSLRDKYSAIALASVLYIFPSPDCNQEKKSLLLSHRRKIQRQMRLNYTSNYKPHPHLYDLPTQIYNCVLSYFIGEGNSLTALKPYLITQSPAHLLTPNKTGGEVWSP